MTMKISIIPAALLMMASCYNKASDSTAVETPVARVGTHTLSHAEVSAAVPDGLSEADSMEYVRQYVNRWVDDQLIEQGAAPVLDMDAINRRVEKYRRDLIAAEYRRYCFDRNSDTTFTEQQLKDYYNRNKELFTSTRPMVKGIYLKVPDHARNLREIRRLLQRGSRADIDRLEGLVAGSAIHYDYFRDKWIEWRQIEQIIPTRFDSEPMEMLRGRKLLDLSLGGFTYLLKIDSCMAADSPLPFDQALPQIRQRLTSRARMNFDAAFPQYLRQQAQKDGKMEINI